MLCYVTLNLCNFHKYLYFMRRRRVFVFPFSVGKLRLLVGQGGGLVFSVIARSVKFTVYTYWMKLTTIIFILIHLCISGSHAHRENERSQCKSCGTYLGTNVRVTKSSFSFLLAANCQYNSGSLQSCIGRIQFMVSNQFKHFHTSPSVSFSFA